MIAFSLNLFGSQNPYFWFIHICKKYLICSLKQLFMLMLIQECMVFLFLVLMVVGVCSLCWCLWWWWCLLCSVTQSVWCLWCQTLVRLSLPVNLPGSNTGAILTLRPCLLTFTLVCSHRWLLNLILDTCFIIDFGHTFLFCFFHFFFFCLRFGFKIVGLNGRKSEKGQRTDLEVRRRILGRKRPKILSFTAAAEPRGPKLNIRPRQSRPRKLAPVWTCHLGTAPPAAPPPSAPRQDLLRGRPRVPRHAQTPGPEPCPSFKTPSTRDGKIRGSTGDHSSIHRPVFVVLLYSFVVNFY